MTLVMRSFFTCTIVADERAPPSRTPQKSKGLMGARFEGQSVTAVAISDSKGGARCVRSHL